MDKNIALYVYLPTYFHVPPDHQRIAERIEVGLRIINANGKYEALFIEHNKFAIGRADLNNRKIIRLTGGVTDDLWNKDIKFLFTTPDMLAKISEKNPP